MLLRWDHGTRRFFCAQVAERLMAAGCKPAAPWSYGGSNPPLCTRILVCVEICGSHGDVRSVELLSWLTLSDHKIRFVAMLLIGMFAMRTWAHHRRELLANAQNKVEGERE